MRKEWADMSLPELLTAVLTENYALNRNLTEVQTRSTELLNKARDWRKQIIELGGKDPGPP
jgi:hypothetical protein